MVDVTITGLLMQTGICMDISIGLLCKRVADINQRRQWIKWENILG